MAFKKVYFEKAQLIDFIKRRILWLLNFQKKQRNDPKNRR